MSAKMPETRIKGPSTTISELSIGSEALVEIFAVHVDLDRSCYLDPKGQVFDTVEGMLTVKVRRDAEGFHLYLNSRIQPFHMYAIDRNTRSEFLPVHSISE